MFRRWFRQTAPDDGHADAIYRTIVAQARQPDLYRHLGVPDTVAGRLEMILLHCVLLFHRLRRHEEEGSAIAQEVFDIFVADMDRSLREMGVNDLAVPKRMKMIGGSFYGRADAYGQPIAVGDPGGLAAAFHRNLLPDESPDETTFAALAEYALAATAALTGQSFAAMSSGNVVFVEPSLSVGGKQAAQKPLTGGALE